MLDSTCHLICKSWPRSLGVAAVCRAGARVVAVAAVALAAVAVVASAEVAALAEVALAAVAAMAVVGAALVVAAAMVVVVAGMVLRRTVRHQRRMLRLLRRLRLRWTGTGIVVAMVARRIAGAAGAAALSGGTRSCCKWGGVCVVAASDRALRGLRTDVMSQEFCLLYRLPLCVV